MTNITNNKMITSNKVNDLIDAKHYIRPDNYSTDPISLSNDYIKRISDYYQYASINNEKNYKPILTKLLKHFKSRRYTTLDFKRQKNNKKDKRIKSRKGIRNRRMKISSIDDKKVFGFQLSLVVKRNNVFGHFLDLKKQKTLATCSSGKSKIKVSKKTVRFFYSSILAKFIKKVKFNCFHKKKVIVLKRLPITNKKILKSRLKKNKWKLETQLKLLKNKSKKKLIKIRKLFPKNQINLEDILDSKKFNEIKEKEEKLRNKFSSKKTYFSYTKQVKKRLTLKKNCGIVINIVASSRLRRKLTRTIKYILKKIPLIVKVDDKKIFNGCRAKKQIRKKRRKTRFYKPRLKK